MNNKEITRFPKLFYQYRFACNLIANPWCCILEKGQKINVYNAHLELCPNKRTMIEDDKQLNETLSEILARHIILQKQKKVEASKFKCTYCGRVFASENLSHLLGCAQANPDDREKLIAYFE